MENRKTYSKPVVNVEKVFETKAESASLFARCWGASYGAPYHLIPNCKTA